MTCRVPISVCYGKLGLQSYAIIHQTLTAFEPDPAIKRKNPNFLRIWPWLFTRKESLFQGMTNSSSSKKQGPDQSEIAGAALKSQRTKMGKIEDGEKKVTLHLNSNFSSTPFLKAPKYCHLRNQKTVIWYLRQVFGTPFWNCPVSVSYLVFN